MVDQKVHGWNALLVDELLTCKPTNSDFGGLVVSTLAAAEAVWFFGRIKILSTPSFGGEVKPPVPWCSFAACKNRYNYRGGRNCKLNSLGHFSPIVLPFSARGLSRHLGAERAWRGQVRPKTGWHNQPIGCSAHGGETHRPYSKKKKEKRLRMK
jgi:hypothetical protein